MGGRSSFSSIRDLMTINSNSKSTSPVGGGTRASHKPHKSNQQLPHSPVSKRLPSSGTQQTTLSSLSPNRLISPQLRVTTSSNRSGSAYYANDDLDLIFVEEFLSHQKDVNESKARAELKTFTKLPGSTIHSHAENQMLLLRQRHKASCDEKTPPATSPGGKFGSSGGSVPNHHDTKRRNNELLATRNCAPSGKFIKDGRKKLCTPYDEVNSKISRVLQHAKPRDNIEVMQVLKLDEYYRLVTKESSAAITLQSQCRRVLAAERCRKRAFRREKATMIQCFVRSYFARMLLMRLVREREWATGVRNQLIRVYVSRYRRQKRVKLEHSAAIVCQCAIRMHIAKQITNQLRMQQSWELNQRRWRVISIRLAWADNRVNFHARRIQCVVRRDIARRRVLCLHDFYTRSSIRIQACWRRYIASKQWSSMIYQLNVEVRCNRIRIIISEHRFWRDKVEELASKQQLKNNFEAQKVNLEKERCELHDKIHALELYYRDQLRLLEQTTPQTIAGGWEEQIRINLRDVRDRITKAKLELFFDVEKKLKSVVKEIGVIRRREDEAKYRMEHWGTWLDDEMEELWQFQRQHDQEVEADEKKQSINHERMVWGVKFRMPSGKPDKRRLFVRQIQHENDCDRNSFERLRQLVDAAQLQADTTRAVNHLANTFEPFQNMWNRFNSLNMNDFTVKREFDGTLIAPSSMSGDEPTTYLSVPSTMNKNRVFPSKLPWDLLEKVREEKNRIAADLGPKH